MSDKIFVLNKRDEIIGVLDNSAPKGCPYKADKHFDRLENGYQTFEFFAPISHETGVPEMLQNKNKVAFMDLDGKFRLFVIEIVEDDTENEERYVWAEFDSAELYNTIYRPGNVTGSPRQVLTTLLGGTRWQVGNTSDLATQEVIYEDYISTIQAIHEAAKEFNGEVDFYVELGPGGVTGRFVDLVEELGQERGIVVDYMHDLKGLKRRTDTSDLATALIGLGGSDDTNKKTTFESIAWSKSLGHPADKPAGQDWVGDPEALAQFSVDENRHIMRVWSESEEKDPSRLLYKTWDELQRRKKATVTYEADMYILESFGLDAKKIRKGDTITIKDHTFETPLILEARILDLERSKSNPDDDKAVLGEYRLLELDTPQLIKQLQETIAKKDPEWSQGGGGLDVTEADIPPENPAVNQYWLDTSKNPNIWNRWNGSQWIPATPSTPQEIGAETPEGAQAKADAAKEAAKSYTNTQLVNFVDASTYNQDMIDLQGQIDGNITSWFYNYDPTLSNAPANSWTTNAIKDSHLGDLFYNSSNGYAWRFGNVSGTYQWIQVKDTDVTKALQDAQKAQDTADSKRRVFVSQPVPPYDIGDLWTSGASVFRSVTSRASGTAFNTGDWQKVGDVTSANTAADTAKVGGTPAADMETKTGAQAKADAAKTAAQLFAENASNIKSGIIDVSAIAMQTAANGSRIRWDGVNGLVQYDANNNVVMQLGLNGSAKFAGQLQGASGTFNGSITAQDTVGLTSISGAWLQSRNLANTKRSTIDSGVLTQYDAAAFANVYYQSTVYPTDFVIGRYLKSNNMLIDRAKWGVDRLMFEDWNDTSGRLADTVNIAAATGINITKYDVNQATLRKLFEIEMSEIMGFNMASYKAADGAYEKYLNADPGGMLMMNYETVGNTKRFAISSLISQIQANNNASMYTIDLNGARWTDQNDANVKMKIDAANREIVSDRSWTDVTFRNGFYNYSTAFSPPGYYKDELGFVHLRGLVGTGTGTWGTSPTANSSFQLPADMRPPKLKVITVIAAVGSGYTGVRVQIDTNGYVIHYGYTGSTVPAWISLEGVTFDTRA